MSLASSLRSESVRVSEEEEESWLSRDISCGEYEVGLTVSPWDCGLLFKEGRGGRWWSVSLLELTGGTSGALAKSREEEGDGEEVHGEPGLGIRLPGVAV